VPLRFLNLPRLALTSLPVVGGVVVAKALLEAGHLHPLRPNPLLSGVVAATVFLLGFLLAGTMSDYKESERIPGDIAASLETIADECLIVHADGTAPEAAVAAVGLLGEMARGIVGYVHRTRDLDAVLALVRSLNEPFRALTPVTQPGFVTRLKGEQAAVRRMVLRIETIRSTSFVSAGYTITELTGALLVVGLVLSDLGRRAEALFFTGVITLLLTYMFLLIRDLDDPFRYAKGVEGAADVSLAPLDAVAVRLAAAQTQMTALGRQR
jgi:branched-subunit amino acid transport protein AzlD